MEPITGCVQLSGEFVKLEFSWSGTAPKAGQFFMLRPESTSVFLGRPVSVAGWNNFERIITFLVQLRGPGTKDLARLRVDDKAQLSGPLGNGWLDVSRPPSRVALVSGGIGIAPLLALAVELGAARFDFYAGFRTLPRDASGDFALRGALPPNVEPIIATDDGTGGRHGSVADLVDPNEYEALYVCGSLPLMRAVAMKARDSRIRCYVSMERRMACGVGACLGCTVRTIRGNQKCCSDGPVFDAEEVLFG